MSKRRVECSRYNARRAFKFKNGFKCEKKKTAELLLRFTGNAVVVTVMITCALESWHAPVLCTVSRSRPRRAHTFRGRSRGGYYCYYRVSYGNNIARQRNIRIQSETTYLRGVRIESSSKSFVQHARVC